MSLVLFIVCNLSIVCHAGEQCRFISKGVEYCFITLNPLPEIGDGKIHVVRIDPSKATLKLLAASELDKKVRTTAQWCKDFGLVAAINAGMYGQDLFTNVGFLRNGSYMQNRQWNKKYKSVLAFDPLRPGIPPAIMVELEETDAKGRLKNYNAVIQNLRLIKGNGINVWETSDKRWSESAVGMDALGRILFLFCQSPYPMREFNEIIKSSGLGIVRMMHMEGGHIASLSVRTREISLDLAGINESMITPDEVIKSQWPIPNIIGVKAR